MPRAEPHLLFVDGEGAPFYETLGAAAATAEPPSRTFPRQPPPPRRTAPPLRRDPPVPACAISTAAQAAAREACASLGLAGALQRLARDARELRAAALALEPCQARAQKPRRAHLAATSLPVASHRCSRSRPSRVGALPARCGTGRLAISPRSPPGLPAGAGPSAARRGGGAGRLPAPNARARLPGTRRAGRKRSWRPRLRRRR